MTRKAWRLTAIRRTSDCYYPWAVTGVNHHKDPPEEFSWHVRDLSVEDYDFADLDYDSRVIVQVWVDQVLATAGPR